MKFTPPKDKQELEEREAEGIIRASRFVRAYAKRIAQPINLEIIYRIHRIIFERTRGDAGKLRKENCKIKHSKHIPPDWSKVPEEVYKFNGDLTQQLIKLRPIHLKIKKNLKTSKGKKQFTELLEEVVRVVAWAHHKLVWIHPFTEGNGRTTRLLANLILERYDLPGVSVKIEKENKQAYLNALAQIDDNGDDRALIAIIKKGVISRLKEIVDHNKRR